MIVSTEGAIYVVDAVAGVLTRYPREGGRDLEDFGVASLRKDGEAIPYLAIGTLRVGQPTCQPGLRMDGSCCRTQTRIPGRW